MLPMRMFGASVIAVALLGCGGETGETAAATDNMRRERLQAAETWMYQLSALDTSEAVETLAATDYPMLVLEPGHNHRGPCGDFNPADYGIWPGQEHEESACADIYDTASVVQALRNTPDGEERLLIAYIDIGQAEWYRDYWVEGWAAPPEGGGAGTPDFMLTVDPDGWTGNFVVAYWDDRWKDIWLGTDSSPGIIAELAAYGFDGVYLDWIEAYDDTTASNAAQAAGLDAAEEMALFVEEIGDVGRETFSDFLVISQNATFLLDAFGDPSRYASVIDALAVEDTWYYGNGSTEDWNAGDGAPYDISDRLQCEIDECKETIVEPDNVCHEDERKASYDCLAVSGDLHGSTRHGCLPGEEGTSDCWSTENRLAAYERYQAAGVPVFSVDYIISADKATQVYQDARGLGLVPLVTRVQLSRHTDTPPWEY